MAKNNLVVHLSGDASGLEGTLNSAKQSIQNFGNSANKLTDIQDKFEKITNSTAPLKRKLRELQTLMANMNMDGLSNTDLFSRLAQQAGTYSDALGDARTAVAAFADDNMKLEAMAQGFQLVAGSASVVTGVMGMLGVENEKVQKAMLQVQSALALVNGVQAIANVLNKDSALMLRIKQIRLAANTAAQKANTTAITANTVSETANNTITKASTVSAIANTASTTANTVATTANTVARNAWNMAVAIGKALFGDFTGLVLVGAAALATYAIATSDSTKEVEKGNQAIDNAKKRFNEYNDAVANNSGDLVGKFQLLKSEWDKLKTTAEKTQWIKNNKTELANLGLSVGDLTTAERIFVNDTPKVVKALEARAKAMAAQTAIQNAYSDYYKQKMQNSTTVEGGGYYYTAKSGGNGYAQDSQTSRDLTTVMKNNGDVTKYGDAYNENGKYYTMKKGNFVLTEYGAKEVNKYHESQALQRLAKNNQNAQTELDRVLDFYNKEIEKSANEIAGLGLGDIVKENNNSNNNNNNNSNKPTEKKIDYLVSVDDGSLQTAEKKLQAFTEKKKTLNIDDTEAINKVNAEITKWSREVILRKIAIEGDDNIKQVVKEISELEQRRNEIKIALNSETVTDKINQLKTELDGINNKLIIDYIKIGITPEIEEGSVVDIEEKIKQLENVRKILFRTNADPDTIKQLENEIKDLKNQLSKEEIRLGIKPEIQEGSLNWIKQKIKEKEEEIALALNTNIDPESMKKLQQQLADLRKQEEAKEIEIGVKTNVPTLQKTKNWKRGSVEDKRASLENANSMVSDIQQNYRLGLIGADEVNNQLAEINAKLAELGLEPITLTFNDDGTLTTQIENLERYQQQMGAVSDSVGSMGSVFTSLGSAIGDTTGQWMQFAGQSLNAVSQLIPQIATLITAKQAEAVASGTASASAMPFPFNLAAIASIVATIASVFASLPKFETGGVIGGNSFTGDKLLVRANSGEMILNKKQQTNLYNQLDNAEVGRTKTDVNVTGELICRGSNLKATLNNYDSKMNKIK